MRTKAARVAPSPVSINTLSFTRIDAAFAFLGVTVAAYVLITTALIVYTAYSPLPFEDSWREWRRYLAYGNYSAFLFSQHNEHRIFVPRLFFLIDRFVFHARYLFPLICSLLAHATTGLCLYKLARRGAGFSKPSRVLLACVICCGLFSAQQFPNLVQGFQIGFTVLYCAVCSSFLALLRAAERREEGGRLEFWFAISCLLALVATYSSANGLLCWLLLLLLAQWLRFPLRFMFTLAGCMILFTALYMWGYQTPAEHSNPLYEISHHFADVLIRSATFLGSPADLIYAALGRLTGRQSVDIRVTLAAVCGFTVAAAALWGGILLWRRPERFTKGHAALVHVALFVILTAGMVGLGRGTFPLTSSLDARYKSHGFVLWIAVGAVYWRLAEDRLAKLMPGRQPLVFSAILLAIIVGLALTQPSWMQFSREYASTQREIEAAIVSDVYDAPVWTKSFPFPPYGTAILGPADYLRRNRLSVFTEAWTRWIGQPVESLFTVDHANSCAGSFDAAIPIVSLIKPGWRVSGWAWDKLRQRGPESVILVDPTQKIAGVVRNTVDRADVLGANPDVQSARVGWSGYVEGNQPKITAYLLEQDGHSLCVLGTLTLPSP